MLRKKPRIIRFDGNDDQDFYNRRTVRNGCFLGIDKRQQELSQEIISNSVVGVAGCGGLGSHLAVQLARMGVKHIKIGDPDTFEESNINRQLGAGAHTIGKNKSLVIAEMINESMPDVTVEVFPEGIQRHTADDFVKGCDLLYDLTDYYLIDERYALHRAFKKHEEVKACLCACIWGWGSAIYKFSREGMSYEELTGIKEGEDLTEEKIDRLTRMQANYLPRYPSKDYIYNWMEELGNIPILGAIPPIAHGFLTAQGVSILCGLDKEPYANPLPPVPEYFWIDTQELSSGFYSFDGEWINEDAYSKHFETA